MLGGETIFLKTPNCARNSRLLANQMDVCNNAAHSLNLSATIQCILAHQSILAHQCIQAHRYALVHLWFDLNCYVLLLCNHTSHRIFQGSRDNMSVVLVTFPSAPTVNEEAKLKDEEV